MPDLVMAGDNPCVYLSSGVHRFRDGRGALWTVFDCCDISKRLVVVGTGSMAAEYRVFIAATSEKRIYVFDPGESREAQLAHVLCQFEAAIILEDTH